MFKLLFTGILIYLLYRTFFSPPKLGGNNQSYIRQDKKEKNAGNDDEYIDYEEVD